MSGSIACFKACQLISNLMQLGFEVQCVCTENALKFIGEATLEGLTGKNLISSSFTKSQYMSHIHLQREADLIVHSPATANSINQFAAGVSNNILGDIFLAHDFKKDFFIFPAMNEKMLLHPSTQASMQKLKSWGVKIFLGQNGNLACGESGSGRLMEANEMTKVITDYFDLANNKKEIEI